MADLAITNITTAQSSSAQTIQLGEMIPAFDVVYRNSADSKYYKADALTAEKAAATHILLTSGNPDDNVFALPLSGGALLILAGVTLTVATRYVVSATGGKIAPRADLISGQFLTELFLAETAANAKLDVNVSGIAIV